jgi:HlyD family secretion protein
MRFIGRWSALLIMGVVAVSLAVSQAQPANDPVKLTRAAAKTITVAAQIEAAEQTPIDARVLGYVKEVAAALGDHVKKGQVLAEQLVPDLEADRRQKEAVAIHAELEIQHAQLALKQAKATVAVTNADVKEAESELKTARAKLDFAKTRHERLKQLQKDQAVEQRLVDEIAVEVENAKSGVETAEARIITAKAAVETAVVNLESAELNVKSVDAQLAAAKAELERSAAMVLFAKIAAPFDGVITQRQVEKGMLVGPTSPRVQPLFVVSRLDTVRVVFFVGAADVPSLRVGAAVVLTIGDKDVKATIARTAGILDEKGLMRVEVDLPNADGQWLVGRNHTIKVSTE